MHTDPASTKCISPAIEHSNLNTHEVSEDDRSQVDSSYDGSQVLFSQDCDTIIKNSDKTRQGYVNMSMETSDSVNNVQLCGPNMSTVHSNRDFVFDPVVIPTDSTTCGIQIIQEPFDLSERHYSSKRPRMDTGTTKSVPGKSKTKGNVSNKDCDIRKFLNKGNTNKRFHPHTIVESSNVFNSNQNFSVSASSTITCNTSTVDSEESPYPFAQHSNNPALNIRKETQEWKKLNPHSTKFKVSVKPSKKSENSYKHGIMSVNHLSVTQLKHVLSLILDSNEVIISLVYNNGSTQLRDCLFGSDKSKNNGKMKQKCDVDSIVLLHNGIIYMFPIVNSVTDHCEVLREFFPALLRKCEIRKIGLHVKELLIAFVKFLGTEKFIDLSWTIMDCSIAWWLLDPDHPISNLEQLLSLLGLPQQTPCDSCIDALLEDMTLLSSAMQRLDQELHRKDLWMLYLCLETPLVNVIARMELRCLTVSTHTLLLFSTLLKRNLTRLDQRAHKAVGHVFVLNSHQQLRQVLFEELRLDSKISGKTKLAKTSVTKEMSTSESVLNQLSSVHPLPSIVLEYRQVFYSSMHTLPGLVLEYRQLCYSSVHTLPGIVLEYRQLCYSSVHTLPSIVLEYRQLCYSSVHTLSGIVLEYRQLCYSSVHTLSGIVLEYGQLCYSSMHTLPGIVLEYRQLCYSYLHTLPSIVLEYRQLCYSSVYTLPGIVLGYRQIFYSSMHTLPGIVLEY
ncbi:hypothetical protein ACF0H5_009421 [Mactra antiquata]